MATLEPEEIDTLMAAIEEGRVGQVKGPKISGPVGPVDLTDPARNIPEPMPAFEAMAERIGRRFSGAISGRIRRRVKVEALSSEKMSFGDFMPQLAGPVVIAVMDLGVGSDTALVVLDANFGEALLLAGLGAQGEDPPVVDESRALTALEKGVVRRLLTYLADAVTVAFSGLLRLDAQLLRVESDPRLAVTAPLTSMAILSTYRIEGDLEGELRLLLPFSSFEGVRTKLKGPPMINTGRLGANIFTTELEDALHEVDLDVVVDLGQVTLSVNELLSLQVGEVLTLHTDEQTPLPVRIGSRTKMRGRATVIHGGLGIIVEDDGQFAPARQDLANPVSVPSLPLPASHALPPAPHRA